MIETILSLLSTVFNAIGAAFLAVGLSVFSFFGYAEPSRIVVDVVTPPLETASASIVIATSSPTVVATTTVASETKSAPKKVIPIPINVQKKIPITTTTIVVTTTVQANQPLGTNTSTTPLVATSTPISTSTPSNMIGTTTLAIQSVPLLVGGTVHAGETVPVSYLQITNIGSEGALLKGFWITQSGSAPVESIIGLSTVDDKGGSRGLNGGTESSILFQNGLALAPTDAFFAPGQMRLFTIKAIMTRTISPYVGTQLMLEVASIETTAAVRGQFPIRGTTWTISQ